MLAILELTLKGTIFIYQGQEIGMTNFDFKSLDQVNDVESNNLNKLMKKMHIPGFLRWKWIKASSRDNGRTPMQWSADTNAGFSSAKPWLEINANYKYINYASQKNDPASILNFYKALIKMRKESSCLKYGEFLPIYADTHLMVYQRKEEEETYTVALNFSSRKIKLPKKITLSGTVLVSNTDRNSFTGELLPWEGIVLGLGR